MKTASEEFLATIANLLCTIQDVSGLRERKTRMFYQRGKAYFHFHEASDGELFADARLSSDTEVARHNVSNKTSQENFLALIENDLGVG